MHCKQICPCCKRISAVDGVLVGASDLRFWRWERVALVLFLLSCACNFSLDGISEVWCKQRKRRCNRSRALGWIFSRREWSAVLAMRAGGCFFVSLEFCLQIWIEWYLWGMLQAELGWLQAQQGGVLESYVHRQSVAMTDLRCNLEM